MQVSWQVFRFQWITFWMWIEKCVNLCTIISQAWLYEDHFHNQNTETHCKTFMPGQLWLHIPIIPEFGRIMKTGLDYIVTFRLTLAFHSKLLYQSTSRVSWYVIVMVHISILHILALEKGNHFFLTERQLHKGAIDTNCQEIIINKIHLSCTSVIHQFLCLCGFSAMQVPAT